MEDISRGILIKCKKGDTEAFRIVIRHYQYFVCSVIYRFLAGKYAEEVEGFSREVFIRLFHFIKKCDPEKGAKFNTCVFAVIKSFCFNELRIKRLQLDAVGEKTSYAREEQENEPLSGELKYRVEKCMENILDEQRLIFILKEYEGFSYEEIAKFMEMSAKTVKAKLIITKIKLKDLLWPYLKEDHGKIL
ncbi:MAG: RNA polymerase sigma factor [Candidatus Firestonebacteria bacterium]|nr:RNA polymerase sigma factor [Candidatus Firestonebacteria bacterium]